MFAIAEIMMPAAASPVLASFAWPSMAGVFAWFLLTALVGSALGMLRAATTRGSLRPAMPVTAPDPERMPLDHDIHHREAA